MIEQEPQSDGEAGWTTRKVWLCANIFLLALSLTSFLPGFNLLGTIASVIIIVEAIPTSVLFTFLPSPEFDSAFSFEVFRLFWTFACFFIGYFQWFVVVPRLAAIFSKYDRNVEVVVTKAGQPKELAEAKQTWITDEGSPVDKVILDR